MSPTKKKSSDQFEPPAGSGTLTPAQFQDLASFWYKLGASKLATPLAIAAAIGTILGGLHILWLAFLWVWGRLPR